MTAAAAFASRVAARHRLRRLAAPARRYVFARPAMPARRVGRPAAQPVPRAAHLRLVLAPRVAVSVTNQAPPPAPALRLVPAAPPVADARVAGGRIERLLQRVHLLEVRRESAPAPPTAAFGHRPAVAAPVTPRMAPATMVLARPAATAPAAAPEAPQPPAPAMTPPALTAPARFEIERLADRVMASIDRRFIAERERRGNV